MSKTFFVRYTLRDGDGHIIEQCDDTTGYASWSEANKAMKAQLEVSNQGCTKGIWRGIILSKLS